ncbi:hypothetical protein OWR29_14430 [Actinoplanes sp. Pm04-4]|uniref:Uncharacterized protein n=1 Tax=Paractinoplanes pyxinae TaxID=2997416 RepID=A0ABT4AY69_9ACTN|nr:hypothetical protein [Actinoplanes pyxinae]MCY1139192.1 hypothetical protein [Actinoplanes pyxinae]
MTPEEAAAALGEGWTASLAKGYRDAGLGQAAPAVEAAYYAHLLHDEAQGDALDLDDLTPVEREWAWQWLVAHGVPDEAAQGPVTKPVQGRRSPCRRWCSKGSCRSHAQGGGSGRPTWGGGSTSPTPGT